MSDISEFSEIDSGAEEAASWKPWKTSGHAGKKGKLEKSEQTQKDNKPPRRKENPESSPKDPGKGNAETDKPETDTEKNDVKASSASPKTTSIRKQTSYSASRKRMSTTTEFPGATQKAVGALSPPDLLISLIIHDGRCFCPRDGHRAAEINGNVYIYGGSAYEQGVNDFLKFIPSGNLFKHVESTGKLPPMCHESVMVPFLKPSSGEQALILHGGILPSGKLSRNTWIFDVDKSEWSTQVITPNSPSARHGHAATVIQKDSKPSKLFLFGGLSDDGSLLDDIFTLDEEGAWTNIIAVGEAPDGRCYHSLASYYDRATDSHYVYLFGGDLNGRGLLSNELWRFSLSTNKWKMIESSAGEPPSPRFKHSVAVFDGRMWICGGEASGWFSYYSLLDFLVYDFGANCWFKCNIGSKDLGGHSAIGPLSFVPANRSIYIFGGKDNSGRPTADLFRMSPVCTTVSIGALQRQAIEAVKSTESLGSQISRSIADFTALQEKVSSLTSDNAEIRESHIQLLSQLNKSAELNAQLSSNQKAMEEDIQALSMKIESLTTFIENKSTLLEHRIRQLEMADSTTF